MCLAIHTTWISQFAATFYDAWNQEIHRSAKRESNSKEGMKNVQRERERERDVSLKREREKFPEQANREAEWQPECGQQYKRMQDKLVIHLSVKERERERKST